MNAYEYIIIYVIRLEQTISKINKVHKRIIIISEIYITQYVNGIYMYKQVIIIFFIIFLCFFFLLKLFLIWVLSMIVDTV